MRVSAARVCTVLALGLPGALVAAAPAAADQLTWGVSCKDVPLSLDTVQFFDYQDAYELTPNVPNTTTFAPGISFGLNNLKYPAPDGTYDGTISCTVTANGVPAPVTRSISLTVSTVDGTHRRHALHIGPLSITVPLPGGASVVTAQEPRDVSDTITGSLVLIVPDLLTPVELRMPPVPVTTAATAVAADSATLTGTVDPRNLPATVHFVWGPSGSEPENATPDQVVPAGAAPVAVSAPVTGLASGSSYTYRLVASNSVGPADPVGTSVFTTVAPAVSPLPLPAPPRLVAAQVVSLPGTRRCVSRRSFPIHIRPPTGVTVASARILVNGTARRELTGKALTKLIDLRGLPKGRVTVKVVVKTADGRTVARARTYRTCAPRRR